MVVEMQLGKMEMFYAKATTSVNCKDSRFSIVSLLPQFLKINFCAHFGQTFNTFANAFLSRCFCGRFDLFSSYTFLKVVKTSVKKQNKTSR